MQARSLINSCGEWLRDDGPEADVVISSRVRLARNLAQFRFSPRMSAEEKTAVVELVENNITAFSDGRLRYWSLETMPPLDRQILIERRLISREHGAVEGAHGVAFDAGESLALMVNEEDHLRLQALRSGLQLEAAFADANALDDDIAETLTLAFDRDFGFLTTCPTNVGTGMRISVMLHLPGLVLTRYIENAFRAAHDLKLAVRGLYGEGSEAHGELYQVSNQLTIGQSDAEILTDLAATIESIIAFERRARERLRETEPDKLADRLWRAFGILEQARLISSEEALRHLSAVRLGAKMGILPNVDLARLNRVFLFCQPAHLQAFEGRELSAHERDVARACLIREEFTQILGSDKLRKNK